MLFRSSIPIVRRSGNNFMALRSVCTLLQPSFSSQTTRRSKEAAAAAAGGTRRRQRHQQQLMTLGGQARRSYVVASILQGIHETLPLSGDGNFVAPIALLALGMRTAILPLVWLATKENGKLAKVSELVQRAR